jgi:hypothetical protein
MPPREDEEEKREGHVHEEPAMQEVLQVDLQVEHPALVAPRLNLFDSALILFRHPEFHKTESVVRILTVAESKATAATRSKIRHDLIFKKGADYGFRFGIRD